MVTTPCTMLPICLLDSSRARALRTVYATAGRGDRRRVATRYKTATAQVDELLCKVLCHNLCVLIQSMYEVGIDPAFWT